jgi:hypothetical protein
MVACNPEGGEYWIPACAGMTPWLMGFLGPWLARILSLSKDEGEGVPGV